MGIRPKCCRLVGVPLNLFFALSIFLWCGCDSVTGGFSKPTPSKPANTLTVNVIRVSPVDGAIETAVYFGKLTPSRRSRLGFARGGRVKFLFKQTGEGAKKDEKLAELEQDELENQKREIEQAIQQAQQKVQPDLQTLPPAVQQEIQQLEARLQVVDLELGKGTIVAPYDCLVAARDVDAGDLVSPQSPVIQVVENGPPRVETSLPRKIADRLDLGQLIWVGVGDEPVQAQIMTKSPIESPVGSKNMSLQISSDLSPGSWSFGQTVEIRFFLPTGNSGFWLPYSALNRESGGLWSTFVIVDGDNQNESATDGAGATVARKMLELVQLETDWALVRGELFDGESVIVNGSHRVVTGQRVKTVDVTTQFAKPGAGADE